MTKPLLKKSEDNAKARVLDLIESAARDTKKYSENTYRTHVAFKADI